MKKTLVLLLSAVMLLNISAALAQEAPAAEPRDPQTLVLGQTTMITATSSLIYGAITRQTSMYAPSCMSTRWYPGRTREITRSTRSWCSRWKHRHRRTETGYIPSP